VFHFAGHLWVSDPRLEEEIADRHSFQLFLGLNSGDSIPDETTICRYRDFPGIGSAKSCSGPLMGSYGMQECFLKRVVLWMRVSSGPIPRPTCGRDPDARFTKRGDEIYYGYKAHIGIDSTTKVIHSVEFTPANVHDLQMFGYLVTGRECMVIGDKGYADERRKSRLRKAGIYCGILDTGYRNQPLSVKQHRRNKQLSVVRNAVERPFTFMKHVLQYDRCRYYTLARNRFQFMLAAVVYNVQYAPLDNPGPLPGIGTGMPTWKKYTVKEHGFKIPAEAFFSNISCLALPEAA
jgi:IS5 family transposase